MVGQIPRRTAMKVYLRSRQLPDRLRAQQSPQQADLPGADHLPGNVR
jgi:hypothetical protein